MKVCAKCEKEIDTKDGENTCKKCKKKAATKAARQAHQQLMKSLGLNRVVGALGGVYYE